MQLVQVQRRRRLPVRTAIAKLFMINHLECEVKVKLVFLCVESVSSLHNLADPKTHARTHVITAIDHTNVH